MSDDPEFTRVTSKRLDQLIAAERKLHALEAAGIDNTEAYAEAMRELRLEEEDA